MSRANAPVLCNVCRAGTGATLFYAGMIRDDALPARCALCGFRLDSNGRQLPEPKLTSPPTKVG